MCSVTTADGLLIIWNVQGKPKLARLQCLYSVLSDSTELPPSTGTVADTTQAIHNHSYLFTGVRIKLTDLNRIFFKFVWHMCKLNTGTIAF